MFGFLLGSYCAKLYVDIGYVDMGKCKGLPLAPVNVMLPPKDKCYTLHGTDVMAVMSPIILHPHMHPLDT